MALSLRALLDDRSPARPARPRRRDVAIALGCATLIALEGVARSGLAHRALDVLMALAVAAALVVRASRPLLAMSVAFGSAMAHTALTWGPQRADGLYSAAFALVMPYSLARWGSAREMTAGLCWIVVAYAASVVGHHPARAEDWVGSIVVLLFPFAIGASVRFRAETHQRELEHARWREREALARELHDTVAHHLAAVTIQAQAARAVLARKPAAAEAALGAIESEASLALTEMRRLVGALRDAPMAPQPDLAAIDALSAMTVTPQIKIHRDSSTIRVPASVQAALYRIAREAVTNAVRHAKSARSVDVRVTIEDGRAKLSVIDDGAPSRARDEGFGLLGMSERASLLGGTLVAGPLPRGGWSVEASIPLKASEL
jgi:signal transduction histidine kinase